MNILLVDQDDLQSETRAILLNDMRHHRVDIVETYDAAVERFEQDEYQMVVIDFLFDFGRDFLTYLDRTAPQQRVITLSATVDYSEPLGCEYCQQNHRRHRLVKPVSLQKLILHIEDFDLYPCEHFKSPGETGC